MSARIQLWLSRLFFAIGLILFAVAGWLWWTDGPPAPVLHVDAPVQVGTIAVAADHAVEVPVINRGSEPIRLVGLDKEQC